MQASTSRSNRCFSEILAGNLNAPEVSETENSSLIFSNVEDLHEVEIHNLNIAELNLADQIIESSVGVSYCIRKLIKLIIEKQLSSSDILVQALCYRIQQITDGGLSIRYQQSYGMFWAGVRNISKSRSLVAFKEHFPIPSDLSKFTKLIHQACGLDEQILGKSGVQSSSVRFWLNTKQREQQSKMIPLSLAVDGKKIVASSKGAEDLGGLGSGLRASDEEVERRREEEEISAYVESLDDRVSCFKLYDKMTNESYKLVSKLTAIDKLLKINTKRAEKNGNLHRYIYVLNEQKTTGQRLLRLIQGVQSEIIKRVSIFRKCSELVADDSPSVVNLSEQENYIQLQDLQSKEIQVLCDSVDKALQYAKDVLCFSWDLVEKLHVPCRLLKKNSTLFLSLFMMCVVRDDELYTACGLGRQHPLSDMKEVYEFCHTVPSTARQNKCKTHDDSIVAVITSYFGPMTFGKNMILMEGGLFVTDRMGSSPEFVAMPNINSKVIEFSVKVFREDTNTFQISEEHVVAGLASAYIVNASKGCLVVLYSYESCVIFSLKRNDDLIVKMRSFIDSYLKMSRCIGRRSPEMIQNIEDIRKDIIANVSNVDILGSYPLVLSASNIHRVQDKGHVLLPLSRSRHHVTLKSLMDMRSDIKLIMNESKKFLIKQAKELIVVNVSDISGTSSAVPHTILAATYLSGSSLKTIVRECLKASEACLDQMNAKVINISVDGESLHLATSLPDGSLGTELQLAKNVLKMIEKIPKNELIGLVSMNGNIDLKKKDAEPELSPDDYFEEVHVDEILNHINESIAVDSVQSKSMPCTLEDVRRMLESVKVSLNAGDRRETCKSMPVKELRELCLREIFPSVQAEWLTSAYGGSTLTVKLKDEVLKYSPKTVFEKSDGFFKTVTFDTAHIINLLRESAAKGKLKELGLSKESLNKLSETSEYSYLINILKLKNGALMYDPMNQGSSYKLFSEGTEQGLKVIGDISGAKCCRAIREGLIESLDSSGVSSENRCRQVYTLKNLLDSKISILDKLRRPGENQLSSELVQMMYCTLDSHLVTYLNCSFFNPRRKSTGSVEQFFSQITLMNDGGLKLNCDAVADILRRVTITNSLRLLPDSVKGFSFLRHLNVHMKSYLDTNDDDSGCSSNYPQLKSHHPARLVVVPLDSPFDAIKSKKRKVYQNTRTTEANMFDGAVRKYHRKFENASS